MFMCCTITWGDNFLVVIGVLKQMIRVFLIGSPHHEYESQITGIRGLQGLRGITSYRHLWPPATATCYGHLLWLPSTVI